MKYLLDAIAVGGSMLGSILIASNSSWTVFGYMSFLTASIATSIILVESNVRRSLLWLNVFYVAVNTVGIYNYW